MIAVKVAAPSAAEAASQARAASYTAQFRRDLKDSDALHWGEGTVSVGKQSIVLQQAENRLHAQKAVMLRLLGGSVDDP